MKKFLVLGVFLFFVIGCTQQPGQPKIGPVMPDPIFACSADSDCIKVNAGCCGCNAGGKKIAINKNFEAEWEKQLSCETKDVYCIQVISNDPSCYEQTTAKCVQGQCKIV